jgi:hypothetical protein
MFLDSPRGYVVVSSDRFAVTNWLEYSALAFTFLLFTGCSAATPTNSEAERTRELAQAPAVAAEEAPVSVRIYRADSATENAIVVEFTNTTVDQSVKLLKPIDGSEWSWIMPYYRTTVTDQNGKAVKLCPRCGDFGYPYYRIRDGELYQTNWPDDYVLMVEPGQSEKVAISLPQDIRKSATYNVSFEYVFEPREGAKTGGGSYPEDLWRGKIKSAVVAMKLTAAE